MPATSYFYEYWKFLGNEWRKEKNTTIRKRKIHEFRKCYEMFFENI